MPTPRAPPSPIASTRVAMVSADARGPPFLATAGSEALHRRVSRPAPLTSLSPSSPSGDVSPAGTPPAAASVAVCAARSPQTSLPHSEACPLQARA
eukprot:2532076-Pleurochrysis_carterae.AAC.1